MSFIVPNAVDYGVSISDLTQAEPDKVDFQILGDRRSGVISGAALGTVDTVSGYCRVPIGTSSVMIEGVYYELSGSTVTIDAAPASGSRFDLICATSSGYQTIKGTESANPVFPDVTAGYVPLYAVTVKSGLASSNPSRVVVDKRTLIGPAISKKGTATPTGGVSGDLYYITGSSPATGQSTLWANNSGTWENLAKYVAMGSTNTASTLVLRDASGNFAGQTITAASFSGNGAAVTNVNASSLNSRTASTTADNNTLVLRDASGNIVANNVNGVNSTFSGLTTSASYSGTSATITTVNGTTANFGGTVTGNAFSGNGALVTNVNAASLNSKTAATAATADTLVLRDASGNVTAATVNATAFSGGSFSGTTGSFSGTVTGVNATFSGTISGASVNATSLQNYVSSAASVADTIVRRDSNSDITSKNFIASSSGYFKNSSNSSGIRLGLNNTNSSYIGYDSGIDGITFTSNNTECFVTYAANDGPLLATNNLEYIGVISSSSGSSTIDTEAGSTGFWMNQSPAMLMARADGLSIIRLNNSGPSTSSQRLMEFKKEGVRKGDISITPTGVTFNSVSDYRLKENIADLQSAITLIKELRPVEFTWKNSADNTKTAGFIAHELQSVLPSAVTGDKDAIDENGQPDYQSVDLVKLVPYLVNAIQELTARIEELEGK